MLDEGFRQAFLDGDVNLVLDVLKDRFDRDRIAQKSSEAVITGLRETVAGLKDELEKKAEQLEWYVEKYEREDKDRDQRLERVEQWKQARDPVIEALSQMTAPRVAELNKPAMKTETQDLSKATAQGEMRGATIKAILSSIAASGIVGVIIAAIAQSCSGPARETTVPVPTVQPAGTGYAGKP